MNILNKMLQSIRSALSDHLYFRPKPILILFIAFAFVFTWACSCDEELSLLAIDDTAETDVNQSVDISVAANDYHCQTDGEYVCLHSVRVTEDPGNGTAEVLENEKIRYTPDTDYTGTDQFKYHICPAASSDSNPCNEATVTVTILLPPPTFYAEAHDDELSTAAGETVTMHNLLDNDILHPGADTLTIITPPQYATASADQFVVTYTADEGYSGIDSFEYEVCAAPDICDTATVTIEVIGPAVEEPQSAVAAPTAVDDFVETDAAEPVTIDVTENDTPPGDINPASVDIVTSPEHGTATVNPDGTVDYTPDYFFFGEDTFTYLMANNDGVISNEATVVVEVHYVNTPPVAVDDAADCPINSSTLIEVLNNDYDPGPAYDYIPASSVTIVQQPELGDVLVNSQTGEVTYTPNEGYIGNDTFIYTVTDGWGALSNEAIVVITTAPVCGDGICSPPYENTSNCDDDCHCVDNGICEPHERLNCVDCIPTPTPMVCQFYFGQTTCQAANGNWTGYECDCCKFAKTIDACRSGEYFDFCYWNTSTDTCDFQEF